MRLKESSRLLAVKCPCRKTPLCALPVPLHPSYTIYNCTMTELVVVLQRPNNRRGQKRKAGSSRKITGKPRGIPRVIKGLPRPIRTSNDVLLIIPFSPGFTTAPRVNLSQYHPLYYSKGLDGGRSALAGQAARPGFSFLWQQQRV